MGESEEKETLYRIKDLHDFKDHIKTQVWKKFKVKISDYFEVDNDDVSSIVNKEEVDESYVSLEVLEYEVEKFVVVDEWNKNRGYIMKSDIARLITSLTNEIISKHLNKLVDKGTLEMCWDNEKYEFVWRPKM